MPLTASQLRQNIYRTLDQVLETGVPVEIIRKGKTLKIVPGSSVKKLDNLKSRDCLRGDPDSIVEIDWLKEWRP